MHDKGNQENIFDRADFQLAGADTLQLNMHSRAPGFRLQIPTTSNFIPAVRSSISAIPRELRRQPSDRRASRPDGPALADQNVQYRAVLDTHDQHIRRVHARRICAAGHYTYYPQREPFHDFGSDLQSETSRPGPHTHQRGRSLGCVLRERHPQHEGRSHVLSRPSSPRMNISESSIRAISAEQFRLPGLTAIPACSNLAPYDLTRRRQASSTFTPTRTLRNSPSTCRTPSPKGIGPSTSGFAAISTTAFPRPPGGAPRRSRLQHQAHQYGPACLLRAHHGDSVQRKSHSLQHGMLLPGR